MLVKAADKTKYLLGGVLLFSLNGLLMIFSTPQQVGVIGIIFWFIILALGIFSLTLGMISVHNKKTFRRAGIFSLTLVSILALESLHQLSLRDIVLITLLAGLVEFYLTRSNL